MTIVPPQFPMRLTLIISSLSAGGAERILSLLAQEWAERGHAVTLITLGPTGRDWFALPASVRRIGLDLLGQSAHLGQALQNNLRRVSRLRLAVRASLSDVVISFGDTTNVLTLLAGTGLGIPTVVSERIDPRQQPLTPAWERLRAISYRRATALVIQTEALRTWADEIVPSDRVHVIPNPVRIAKHDDYRDPSSEVTEPTLIATGRLTRQKGFDVLLEAFARCHRRFPEWTLRILGQGEERTALEAQAGTLGIRPAVKFAGVVPHHEAELRRAHLFVLPSRYEGFPNALLEAMAMGLPVIATDCPTGPAEIITHNSNGLLVPVADVSALADALARLMGDAQERERLGARARDVQERFGIDTIVNRWERLLYDCCPVAASA